MSEIDLKDFFKKKLLVHHTYINNENRDECRTKEIINNPKYFEFLFNEYKNINDKRFDRLYYRFYNYGFEYNLDIIDKVDKEIKNKDFNFDELYNIQDYSKHKTINIIDEVFYKYDVFERNFLKYSFSEKVDVNIFFQVIKNLVSQIENSYIKYDVVNTLYKDNENKIITIESLSSIVKSSFSRNEIRNLEDKWTLTKDELNLLLNEYLLNIENEFTFEVYMAEDSEIKKELKRILFEENEEYYVYNDFFKNKSNYDNFLELFSRYFEGKEYNKEIIISLKNGAKTKFNKKLYTIQKNLSEENKLVRDKKYFILLRQIEHFKDIDDDNFIYKSLQK